MGGQELYHRDRRSYEPEANELVLPNTRGRRHPLAQPRAAENSNTQVANAREQPAPPPPGCQPEDTKRIADRTHVDVECTSI
jgi:hypothetical protein